MTIFIVTIGEYSDKRICGVFSSKEKADAYISESAKTNIYHDEFDTEEYTLDQLDGMTEKLAKGLRPYAAAITKDGDCYPEEQDSFDLHSFTETEFFAGGYLRVFRWADSAESITKVANEIRARHIALGTWPEAKR